jgi:hypothetical protein
LVEVMTGKRKRGPGVILSANGYVATSYHYAQGGEVRVRVGKQDYPVRVVLADAKLQVAVLALPEAKEYPTAAVKLETQLQRGSWVLGFERARDGRSEPRMGRMRRLPSTQRPLVEMDISLSPGSPVLDSRGRVFAVTVGRGSSSALAVPVGVLKEQLSAAMATASSP